MGWLDFVIGIVGALIGGGAMYWKQNRNAKVIENEGKLSQEWEKLYREQKSKREENDAKVDELREEVNSLRAKVESMENYICFDTLCAARKITNIKKQKSNEQKDKE